MDISSRLCILAGPVPSSTFPNSTPYDGHGKFLLESTIAKAGLNPSKVHYLVMDRDISKTLANLNSLDIDCIVTLGNKPMELITGESGVDKWHLSPLNTVPLLRCRKCVPTFDFRRLNIQYEMRFFFFKALLRAAESLRDPGPWKRKPLNFTHITKPEEIKDLPDLLSGHSILANDIETSNGVINTVGFAWSKSDAVAIRCEPGYYEPDIQLRLWSYINSILSNRKIKKILQNNVYEGTIYARYGIELNNIWHDTMGAQRLLYPEFKSDLATIGRLYTNEVYWKEDNKDWNRIDNWINHLDYNCKDTTGTYEAAMNQRKELEQRDLLDLFDSYLMELAEPVVEMCCTGLIVDEELRSSTSIELEEKISTLSTQLSTPINHRSGNGKKKLLKDKGYKLPTKTNAKGKRVESVDELSMKKLREKHPHDPDINLLLQLAKLEKFKSSYVEFDYHDDGIVRYSLRFTGTETLRFAGGTDSWDMGFNPQTIPKKAKKFFKPLKGHYFMQVDLSQAESRYVAYRAKDYKLIEMLEDPNQDVHSYVASNIFNVPVDQVIREKNEGNIEKRQLGKKSGHGGNYAMMAKTFMDGCFKEDLVLTIKEAENALEGYHRAFPGIRPWHAEVRDLVKRHGYLETPLGFRRQFWGRMNDQTYREAYAFEPQSTIPMITNKMMLYLLRQRDYGVIDFNIHLQVHDSLVLSCTEKYLETIMKACLNYKLWHPRVTFPVTGDMWIPTECEYSDTNLADMKEYSP